MKKDIRRFLAGVLALFCFCANGRAVEGVKNETAAGVVVSGGNTRAQSYSLDQLSSYGWSGNTLAFKAKYLRSESSGVESGLFWSLGLRYEKALADSWSMFLGETIESDKYAGFFQRYNTDLGAKYQIVKDAEWDWFGEAGYRYSAENRVVPPNSQSHMLRFFTQVDRKWSESVSSRFWIEVLPNLTHSSDYLINSELSLTAALTSVFSAKSAYLMKYRNELPSGIAYKTDSVFTGALVAKF